MLIGSNFSMKRQVKKMGSGRSGNYNGTSGSSQRYARTYKVCSDMKKWDISRGIYTKKNGYTKNPTAVRLKDKIKGNYIGDKHTNMQVPYVITPKGDIIIGKRNGNGKAGLPTPHPTLIGGKNPKVMCAGILEISGGKIKSIDVRSGHYKPNVKSLPKAKEIFENLPKNLFHRKYEWRV